MSSRAKRQPICVTLSPYTIYFLDELAVLRGRSRGVILDDLITQEWTENCSQEDLPDLGNLPAPCPTNSILRAYRNWRSAKALKQVAARLPDPNSNSNIKK